MKKVFPKVAMPTVFLLAGFLVLSLLAGKSTAETYSFVRMWPVLPQPWYFSEPEGIAIDTQGNVFVADTNNHRIQKFDTNGNLIAKWGSRGKGDGQFYFPSGIAVDTQGNVFVADWLNHRIQKFDTNGNFITKWGSNGKGDGQFASPHSIAVDLQGNVFVADQGNNRIQKFDTNGNFIKKWGSWGRKDGQFKSPSGIAVDTQGNVFLVDTGNDLIQKFDTNGNFIKKWGSEGIRNGQFNSPSGIALDTQGNVFVADTNNHRIQKFGKNGNFIKKWGSRGGGDGQFSSLTLGIGIDSQGNVFVADKGNDRIQKFDNNGNFITKWGAAGSGDGQFSFPSGIAVDTQGNVFVADSLNYRIQKFDNNGNFITKWGSEGGEDGQFGFTYHLIGRFIKGIAVDTQGNVFVADTGNNRIQKFDNNGNFITKWGSIGKGDGQFSSSPSGIAVDSQGNVFVADSGKDRIQKFDNNGNFIKVWRSRRELEVQVFPPTAIAVEGIAVDTQGNVFLADYGNIHIQKFDTNGKFIKEWNPLSVVSGQFSSSPSGIAVDTQDNVFFVADSGIDPIEVVEQDIIGMTFSFSFGHNRIQKIDNNMDFITRWGSEGSEDGQFNFPQGIAVDSQGNVFVADTDNHRIQVFAAATGTITTTTIPPGTPTVDLDSPKTDLRTGDSFILDLVLKSGGSKSPIDLFFSIEIGDPFPTTIYLGPDLNFVPDRIPLVINLTSIDTSVRMFGPAPSTSAPSIFGEFIIPSEVMGSFTFGAEVVDSSTKASISRDILSITVNVQP